MDQSRSSKGRQSSDGQVMSQPSQKAKVHYLLHRSSPMDSILNQKNSDRALKIHKRHFNITFPSIPRSPK
jgi:hypothetical protein